MCAYSHSPNSRAALQTAISTPRLATYLRYADNDLDIALELHAWNTALGSSPHSPIQNLEVLVRNACNDQLRTLYRTDLWFDSFPPGDRRYAFLLKEVRKVRDRLRRSGRNPNNAPCIVAGLNFGFWVALFERSLHRDLWVPSLHQLFTHRPPGWNRSSAWDALDRVRNLRNRIAHTEPIFQFPLDDSYQNMVDLASYICPETKLWLENYSNFPTTWTTRPVLNSVATATLAAAHASKRI